MALHSIEKVDSSHWKRTIQPQSDVEYADYCHTWPDPQSPATHEVKYHWEDGPTRNHARRIVFEPVLIGLEKKAEPKPAPKIDPAANVRREDLASMPDPEFLEQYAMAGLGTPPKSMSRAKAVANILEAEAKK